MAPAMEHAAQIACSAAIFVAGIVAGSLHARGAAVQNRFGQPKTVLHVVVYKNRDNVSNYDREKAINGIKDMAGQIPGGKKVFMKRERNQRRDISCDNANEIKSVAVATDYAENPVPQGGSKM